MTGPNLFELCCFLVIVAASRAGPIQYGENSNATFPDVDMDDVKGLYPILENGETIIVPNNLNVTGNGEQPHIETLDDDYVTAIEVDVSKSGCHDYSNGSECCSIIKKIPIIKDDHEDTVCLNMTFQESGTAIKYYLTWNGDVKMKGDLFDFKDDTCLSVPLPKVGNLVDMCIFFTKFSRVNETLNGCVNFKLKILSLGFDVHLGSFGDAVTCSDGGTRPIESLIFYLSMLWIFYRCT